jgi:adenylylsulfate kinase-like enzyme
MNDARLIVITAFISPLREDRQMARAIIGEAYFKEVYVSTAIDVCESRDPKGLYAKARAGEVKEFTGSL